MRDDVDDPMDREHRRHEAERAAYEADLYARELRAERARREVR